MNTIYIINEVLPEEEVVSPSSETQPVLGNFNKFITGLQVGSLIRFPLSPAISLPIALIAAAGLAAPYIEQLLSKNKDSKLQEKTEKEIARFISENGVTLTQVNERGLNFPPGHPVIGQIYRKHPLSNSAKNLYVPDDSYDELLHEEREVELIKILIDLGATKIVINKYSINQTESNVSIEAASNSDIRLSASTAVELSKRKTSILLDSRIFEFDGKEYNSEKAFCSEDYNWLDYEPSWKAVVYGREVGRCKRATININKASQFRGDISATIKAKNALISIASNGEYKEDNSQSYSYSVEVEFSSIKDS